MDQVEKDIIKIVGTILAVVGVVIVLVSSFACVPVGHQGVIKVLGEVKHDSVLPEGLNIVKPIVTRVHNMKIKLHNVSSKAVSSSKDLQDVLTKVDIQMSLANVSQLFQEIGSLTVIEQVLMYPAISESVKSITARYTAEELITKRPQVKDGIVEEIKGFLSDTLKNKGLPQDSVIIMNVAITDFEFSTEFNKAIELKVKAEQQALQAKNEKIKKITDAEASAEKIRIESIAKANAITREAQALKLNPQLIEWRRMEKWNGELPKITGGYIPMLELNKEK